MKKKIGVAAVLGLLAVAALSPSASATQVCTGSPAPFISFNVDTVFAYETAYNNATYRASAGSVLTILGKVVCFGFPFNGLAGNNKEYSVVIQVKTAAGTPPPVLFSGNNIWDTDYNDVSGPQSFAIYEDASPDLPGPLTVGSPASALALFDGSESGVTAILSGTIDYFHTQIRQTIASNVWSGSFNALYHATGGSLYGAVGNGQANLNGLWCSLGTGTSQCTLPPGYSAHPSGKFDQPGTTPGLPATWGKIKMLYR
jgi:hypothetical protein